MPDERVFHRTFYVIEVLSEDELHPDLGLDDIHHMITTGDCSGSFRRTASHSVSAPMMAQLLQKQGSDPGFFRLTESGEDADMEPDEAWDDVPKYDDNPPDEPENP